MSSPLFTLIREHLQQHGSMTIHDYMQLCLQHPEYGYYRKKPAVGKEGDFITAPEISQIFGDLIGMWLIHAWQVCGAPPKATLVELGPGRGTLSADVLRMLHKHPELKDVFSLHLVESNTTLREIQAQKLWRYQPEWHDEITTLPEHLPLFILANEFFDALPIRQFVGDTERSIILTTTDTFSFSPAGTVTHETCPQAHEILKLLGHKIIHQSGCALFIDYGYNTVENLGDRDTLQALLSHQYHPVLEQPGEADLTAHVDFIALKETATQSGLHSHGPVTQGEFLQRLGGEIWLKKLQANAFTNSSAQKTLQEGWHRLTAPQEMGELFKIIAFTPQPCELAGLR